MPIIYMQFLWKICDDKSVCRRNCMYSKYKSHNSYAGLSSIRPLGTYFRTIIAIFTQEIAFEYVIYKTAAICNTFTYPTQPARKRRRPTSWLALETRPGRLSKTLRTTLVINGSRHQQNGRHSADDTSKLIFFKDSFFLFWYTVHWSLFVIIQITISQHWLR